MSTFTKIGIFRYSTGQKKAILAGRTIWLEGANDSRSEEKIRGMTLSGAYLDEATLLPEDFFAMLLSRMSERGARLYATTNPDRPSHWLKTEYIDNEKIKDKSLFTFNIDDNTHLDAVYLESLKSEYTGVFYDRFILGLWVNAQGRIYDMFSQDNTYDDNTRKPGLKHVSTRRIAVDYGTTNPCTFLDIYDDGTTIWVDNQYWWDSRKEMRQKTDTEYVQDIKQFMGDEPAAVTCDPSAASFIVALKSAGIYTIEAKNDVLDGIRAVGTLIQRRVIKIHRHRCANLIREMTEYVWDEKASQRGEEKPLKASDHGVDALRYDINTNVQKWRKGVSYH